MTRRITVLALGVALLTPAQLVAQSDPVIQKIWAIGMDSSWTMKLAQQLFDSIGPRLTGTALQKSGNDWLVKNYTSWGIPAKNE